jgi:apolipoprotein D and lipocalin family protein
MAEVTKVVAIPHLDLNRYLGRWYEICRLPLRWEDATATDITAHYSFNENGRVRVDNRCIDEDGKPSQAIGEASPVDDSNSRLTVTFLPKAIRWLPFTRGDYWILKLDPEYTVSLVGTPDRKYLWILSRTPDLSPQVLRDYLNEATRQGFDLSNLITPKQTGRNVTDDMIVST